MRSYTRQILRMFADTPAAPFSIHNLAQMGLEVGKRIGEWFTPSDISLALRKLSERFLKGQMAIYVSDDGMIYRDEVEKLGRQGGSGEDEWNQSVILLVPQRLGLGSLNEVYSSCIGSLFRIPQSLGVAGGKPKASLYFVASQDSQLFYLDPHQVAPMISMDHAPFDSDVS